MLINLCTCIFKFFIEDPGLTFFSTIIGIGASVWLAKYIFESEQNIKKKEEEDLSINEFKLLEQILKKSIPAIDEQIKYIEDNKNEKLKISNELIYDYFNIINFNRILHYKKDDLLNINNLLIILKELTLTPNLLTLLYDEHIKNNIINLKELDRIYGEIIKILTVHKPDHMYVVAKDLNPSTRNDDKIYFYDEANKILLKKNSLLNRKGLYNLDKHCFIYGEIILEIRNYSLNYNESDIPNILFLLRDYETNYEYLSDQIIYYNRKMKEIKNKLISQRESINNFLEKV